MGIGADFSLCSLVFLLILSCIYFSKPKINNIETDIYGKLLILTIIGLILEVATCVWYIGGVSLDNIFYQYASKLTAAYYMLWTSLFAKYVMSVCNVKKEIIKVANIVYTLCFLAIMFLPISYVVGENTVVPAGPSIMTTYIICIINTIIDIVLCIINKKRIAIKKITPVYSLLLIGTICIIITILFPTTFLIGFQFVLIILIMYFTIENPDVKMAKELAYQKELVDISSKKTTEIINEMSDELKLSIQKLEAFGSKKIDKRNLEKYTKELNDFQKYSIKLSDKISAILDLALIKGNSEIKVNKYETYDMLDKLKQILWMGQENNKKKLSIDISDSISPVLYGEADNVIKIVLYFYELITSIAKDKRLVLKIDDIKAGRFSRLRFKFETSNLSIKDYFYINQKNNVELINKDNVNYEIIQNLLKRFNGKITLIEKDDKISVTLCVDQRVMSEYDIISDKEENKNVKIKYNDYKGKRVLVVDNNEGNIKEIKTLLKPYNLEVYSASTPRQMSKILYDNKTFDLILIDDIIPDFQIDEFTNEIINTDDNILKHIKKDAKYSILTVIMVTPNKKKMEEKYLDFGFSDYIIKPINKNKLDKLLKKHFNKITL